jgi:hypothetical protein
VLTIGIAYVNCHYGVVVNEASIEEKNYFHNVASPTEFDPRATWMQK